jgi:nicotinamidase-related amidase
MLIGVARSCAEALSARNATPRAAAAPALASVPTCRFIRIFIVPHRQWEEGDYESWQHVNPTQRNIMKRHSFAKGTWGGEFHPDFVPRHGDIVVRQHWGQSGFANTDLDLQLKQHGISHAIIVGLLANTCIDSTARFAMELGYHVTLVRDATAAFSRELMHAAHELSAPTFAHAIVTTQELVSALPKAGLDSETH